MYKDVKQIINNLKSLFAKVKEESNISNSYFINNGNVKISIKSPNADLRIGRYGEDRFSSQSFVDILTTCIHDIASNPYLNDERFNITKHNYDECIIVKDDNIITIEGGFYMVKMQDKEIVENNE